MDAPASASTRSAHVEPLLHFLRGASRVAVLTGAGCSTESGIPDYRSPDGAFSRGHKPIQYGEFVRDAGRRRNYWARSYLGWDRFRGARPNGGHQALAALERTGRLQKLITQNVDGLHRAAGHQQVIELHGTNHEVMCLQCNARMPRAQLQDQLAALNQAWSADARGLAPDGDAEVDRALTETFRVPDCGHCGGMLKPAVVFFGENVPRPVVDAAFHELERADRFLVVGSSLTVWSGFRFARRAAELNIPIALLNMGPTRADDLAALKVEARCGALLSDVVAALSG